jgi:hypothetical protein
LLFGESQGVPGIRPFRFALGGRAEECIGIATGSLGSQLAEAQEDGPDPKLEESGLVMMLEVLA